MSAALKPALAVFFLFQIGFISGFIMDSLAIGIAASLVAFIGWHKPHWIFLMLLGLAPFSRSPQAQYISPEVIAQTKALFVFILGGIFFIRNRDGGLSRNIPQWLKVMMGLWFFLTALSWLNSADPAQSLVYILVGLSGPVFFLIAFHSDEKILHRAVWLVLSVALLISILSLIQYAAMKFGIFSFLHQFILAPRERIFLSTYGTAGDQIYRASGTFTHPNQMGAYVAVLSPFVWALLSQKDRLPRERLFLMAMLILMALATYATNSRNAVLMIVCSAAYLGFRRPFRWIGLCGATVIVVLGSLFYVDPVRTSDSLLKITRVQTGISSRDKIWRDSIDMASKNLLLGVGPGNFSNEYVSHHGYFVFNREEDMREQSAMFLEIGESYIRTFQAHNLYLQLAGELGIIAPFLFLASAFALIFYCEWKARFFPIGSAQRAMTLVVASVAFGFMFYGIFESHMFLQTLSLNQLVGTLLAMGLRA